MLLQQEDDFGSRLVGFGGFSTVALVCWYGRCMFLLVLGTEKRVVVDVCDLWPVAKTRGKGREA